MRTAGSFLSVLCLVCATAALADEGLARLECLNRALQSATTWHASYEQTYTPAGMSLADTVEGTVWLAWPDRALFVSEGPEARQMALVGRRVRLVDLQLPSCDDHELDDEEWARIPLAPILEPTSAVDRFTVLELEGADGFVLVPHEVGGVARVELELGARCLPLEVLVVDPQGATNRMRFTNWAENAPPPDGRWLPTPPDGVSCSQDLQ